MMKNNKQKKLIILGLVGLGVLCFSFYIYNGARVDAQAQGQNLDTVRIQKFELIDSKTGDIYCTWMQNGQWQQVKALCDSDAAKNMFGTADGWSGQQGQQFSGSSVQQTSLTDLQAQIDKLNKKLTDQQKQIAALQPQPNAQQPAQPEAQQTTQQQTFDVASVAPISDINVVYGTDFASVNLPTTITATMSDSTTQSVTVTWDSGTPAYDGNTPGTYVFSGTLTLPDNITNTNNVKASVNIIVAAQPAPVEQQPSSVENIIQNVNDAVQNAGASLLNSVGKFVNFIFSPLKMMFHH